LFLTGYDVGIDESVEIRTMNAPAYVVQYNETENTIRSIHYDDLGENWWYYMMETLN
jgi:uncharacterized protein (UPF0297 family)